MKLSSVVKALGSLCVLLANGFPVSADASPHIIGADRVQIKAHPGEPLILHCDAVTNSKDGVTLIYWLINGSFPEEIPSRDRIVELDQSTLEDGTILQRRLLLKNVTPEDFRSTFTCMVTSAVGMAQKQIKLRRIRKKGKH
ncbi:interleukin-1 receptor accessory protein-like isoform X1 [Hippoglossus hippoglossus]|uniref:interleukin-1 receptor accessory protein-like isoform X1 n=1 Tax=Hippoglossus hippoglossus TaxID=8267 RepID=UPI00148D3B26|nr:interleukin-1 receptor accessory protein-like isoform X1 [Hippoglossus hippoglossus]